MVWTLTLTAYALLSFVAAAVSGALAAVAWRWRGRDPVARPFTVLMLSLFAWSACYGMELGVGTLSAQLVWERLGYAGIVVAPTAWLVLTLVYAGRERLLTRRTIGALAVEPLLTLGAVWTNGAHGLVWRSASLAPGAPVVSLVHGPWYWVNLAYSYLLVVAGVCVLVAVFLRASDLSQVQAGALVVGAIVPLGANVLFVADLTPAGVDLTSISFTATGVAFGLALFRLDLLNRTPVARERLVEEAGDGYLVLDDDDLVVDADETAAAALGVDPVDRAADDVLPVPVADVDGESLTATVDGRERIFDLQQSTLYDHRDRSAGTLVTLRNVTAVRRHQERLEVVNRVLRHNIRNDMNVVHGLAGEVRATAADARVVEHATTIQGTAESVLATAEKARHVDSVVDWSAGECERVDVGAVLSEAVADAREERTGAADVAVRVPDDLQAETIDRSALTMAVADLVANALEHGATPVTVSAAADGDTVAVRVADDGAGIPKSERAVVETGEETPLEHGSGLGLWLARWVARGSGGDLSFADDGGTAVSLTLPAAGTTERDDTANRDDGAT